MDDCFRMQAFWDIQLFGSEVSIVLKRITAEALLNPIVIVIAIF